MDSSKTALERAFDLARSGKYHNLTEIKQALTSEGYYANQLDGPALRRQISGLIKDARAAVRDAPKPAQ